MLHGRTSCQKRAGHAAFLTATRIRNTGVVLLWRANAYVESGVGETCWTSQPGGRTA